jgi:hypothetical protein
MEVKSFRMSAESRGAWLRVFPKETVACFK